MDRQHPRDLFDVMQLFEHEGITSGIQRAFDIYLASHNRPVHEVLFGPTKDISQEYERNFSGMTTQPAELSALLDARARMFSELQNGLTAVERQFLLSLVSAKPAWELLDSDHIEYLPGIRWKLQNLLQLQKVNPKKFAEQLNTLTRLLE